MSHKRAYSRANGICIGNLFCIARHGIHEVLEDHLMYEHEHEHEHEYEYEHEHEHEHIGQQVRSPTMVGWDAAEGMVLASVDILNLYQ